MTGPFETGATERAAAGPGAILCAHTDQDGRGMHWLRAGEKCGQASEPHPAGPALVLTASREAVLGQALADAIEYRTPGADCPDCDTHPAGLCEDHASDLDRTDAYLALARALRIELEQ